MKNRKGTELNHNKEKTTQEVLPMIPPSYDEELRIQTFQRMGGSVQTVRTVVEAHGPLLLHITVARTSHRQTLSADVPLSCGNSE